MALAIKYIPHALERMRERGIRRELIEEAIESPDSVTEGYLGRKVAQKRLNGKVIRVIYEEEDEDVVVVTAYVTSKVRKYGGVNK
ncbi:DUF4258 domain-containing protein [Palaeococcus ferrophilus]|uniref:DUF4258 domain-containing protein n=1 Tax=Palaeococcus ferrophilus TaxID=83868 RepID=UPI00064F8CC6|nr:DUF4258 domain-containing protein [Palaeococcus ferrophilus]